MSAARFPPPLWGRDRERGGDRALSAKLVLRACLRTSADCVLLVLKHGNRCSACFTPLPVPPPQGGREPCVAHLRSSCNVRVDGFSTDGISFLLLRLIEIAQVRRRLILFHRHQVAVGAQQIALLADDHVVVAFRAVVLRPDDLRLAPVGLLEGRVNALSIVVISS
jgi:hypothetical protein